MNIEKWGWEAGEIRKIIQHCTIFCRRKKLKEARANKYRADPRLKSTGSRKFGSPDPPPPPEEGGSNYVAG